MALGYTWSPAVFLKALAALLAGITGTGRHDLAIQ